MAGNTAGRAWLCGRNISKQHTTCVIRLSPPDAPLQGLWGKNKSKHQPMVRVPWSFLQLATCWIKGEGSAHAQG